MSPARLRRPTVDVKSDSADFGAGIEMPEVGGARAARPVVSAAIAPILDALGGHALPARASLDIDAAVEREPEGPGWADEVGLTPIAPEREVGPNGPSADHAPTGAGAGPASPQVAAREAEAEVEGGEEEGTEVAGVEAGGSGITGAAAPPGGPPAGAEPGDPAGSGSPGGLGAGMAALGEALVDSVSSVVDSVFGWASDESAASGDVQAPVHAAPVAAPVVESAPAAPVIAPAPVVESAPVVEAPAGPGPMGRGRGGGRRAAPGPIEVLPAPAVVAPAVVEAERAPGAEGGPRRDRTAEGGPGETGPGERARREGDRGDGAAGERRGRGQGGPGGASGRGTGGGGAREERPVAAEQAPGAAVESEVAPDLAPGRGAGPNGPAQGPGGGAPPATARGAGPGRGGRGPGGRGPRGGGAASGGPASAVRGQGAQQPIERPSAPQAPAQGRRPGPQRPGRPGGGGRPGGPGGGGGGSGPRIDPADALAAVSEIVDGVRSGDLSAIEAIAQVRGAIADAQGQIAGAAEQEGAQSEAQGEQARGEVRAEAGTTAQTAQQSVADEVATAQSEGQASVAQADGAAASARGQATAQAQSQAQEEQVTIESLTTRVETELTAQLNALTTEQTTALAEVDTAFDTQLATLRETSATQRAAYETDFETQRDELATHREEEFARLDAARDEQIATLDSALSSETARARDAATGQVGAATDGANAEKASIRATADASAAEARSHAEARVSGLGPDQAGQAGSIRSAGDARAADILAQAAGSIAAVEQRLADAVARIEATRDATIASLTSEHDTAVAAARTQCDGTKTNLGMGMMYGADSGLYEAHTAGLDAIDEQLASSEESIEAERESRRSDIEAEFEARRVDVEAQREVLLADLAEATDPAEIEASIDEALAEVEAQVEETRADVAEQVTAAVAAAEAAGAEEVAAVEATVADATAEIDAQIETRRESWSSAVDSAVTRVGDAGDEAVSELTRLTDTGIGLGASEVTTSALDVATIGATTRQALESDTQNLILDAEIALDQSTFDRENVTIEVSQPTTAGGQPQVIVVNHAPGGVSETTYSVSVGSSGLGLQEQESFGPEENRETYTRGVTVGTNGSGDVIYGVKGGYSVTESGADGASTTSSVETGARIGGGNIEFGWSVNDSTTTAGGETTGTQQGADIGIGSDGVSVSTTDVTTNGDHIESGTTGGYSVGPDGVSIDRMHYNGGVGVGGSVSVGPDGVELGGNLAYKGLTGGATFGADADGHGWNAGVNVGFSRPGVGGASVGVSHAVVTDRDVSMYVGDDASGRHAFARDVVGGDLLSYGLVNSESTSVSASVNVKAVELGFSHASAEGSGVQFMQSVDSVDLDAQIGPLLDIHDDPEWAREYWITTHPEEFQEVMDAQMRDKVDDVDTPSDLELVTEGANGEAAVDPAVLGRGQAWSFDNFDQERNSGTFGLYGIGLTLGGSDMDYQELTIARTGEGEDDAIHVQFTTMDQDGYDAKLSALGLASVGGSETTTNTRTVEFALDPNDPRDVQALEVMTQTGMLPGAENTLGNDEKAAFDTAYAQLLDPDTTAEDREELRSQLSEMSSTANETFTNDPEFDLFGENGGAEYDRRREELQVDHEWDVGLLGFQLANGGFSERWGTTQYREDGTQQTQIDYENVDGGSGGFLGIGSSDAESSRIALNPEGMGGDLALLGDSRWNLNRDQAQMFIDLGLAGSEDFRVQGYADDSLHDFGGVASVSMAMDDAMMTEAMAYFQGQDLDDRWAEYQEEFGENDQWLDYLRGDQGDSLSMITDEQHLVNLMNGTQFISQTDEEERLQVDPLELVREQALRDAWTQNEDAVLESINGRLYDDSQHFTSVDQVMDMLASEDGQNEFNQFMMMNGGFAGDQVLEMANWAAQESYGGAIEASIGAIQQVDSAESFAEMSLPQQEAWLQLYGQTAEDGEGWYALDMVSAAMENPPMGPDGEQMTPEAVRDQLTRRLFREIERGTGDEHTATSEYIQFLGDLEGQGGDAAALAATLKEGVYVSVQDEGVLDRKKEAVEDNAIVDSHLDTESDTVRDLDTEIEHMLDNEGNEDKGDADDLMDRLQGLHLAAGGDAPAVMEEWVDHAVRTAEFNGASAEDFVADLTTQIAPNGEYANKLVEVFRGTPYESQVRQQLGIWETPPTS